MPSSDRRNYDVGYRKPPAQSRIQAGRSGNPRRRPKGSLNLASVLERTLRETVVINENGRRLTITKLEAALKQLVNRAAGGDLGAVKQLCGLVRSAEERVPELPDNPTGMGEADQQLMQRMLSKLASSITDQKGIHSETDPART
jgi:hypothetical protein